MWYIGVARKTRENNKSYSHAQSWQSHRKETKMAQKNLVAASLQTKKRHSARTLEIAGADEDPAALSATESAAETAAKSAAKAAATDTTAQ